jgi:hypothetical protein
MLSSAGRPMHEAIGEQLTWVFVDHGLLRLAEGAEVVSAGTAICEWFERWHACTVEAGEHAKLEPSAMRSQNSRSSHSHSIVSRHRSSLNFKRMVGSYRLRTM